MMSIREKLVGLVVTRLQTIRVSNGFNTDAGQRVFLWRTVPVGQSDLPAIVVRDRRAETSLVGRKQHVHRITFEADLYAGPGNVRALLADVQKVLSQDLRWSYGDPPEPLALDTQPLDDELDAAQEERRLDGCRYRFVVIVATKPFNPFEVAS